MVSIQLRTHVGPDGTLNLRVPTALRETDVEVLVVLQPVATTPVAPSPEALGWPPGFFEETFGCLKDDPIERAPQGDYETREPLL